MEQVVSILTMLVVMTYSAQAARTSNNAPAAFEKLKSLVGEWQGKSPEGVEATLTYQLISGGTAVMETLKPGNEPGMVTVYHLNGDKVMMTHYCSAGNQPRMQAAVAAGDVKALAFVFLDGANLAGHGDGHIHGLTLTFDDKDHVTQEWVWRDGGKEVQMKHTFTRKK